MVEVATDDAIDDTVRHEIAHAIAGIDAGHGPRPLERFIVCDDDDESNDLRLYEYYDQDDYEGARIPQVIG